MDQGFKKISKAYKKSQKLLELNLEAMYKYKETVLYNMLILQMNSEFNHY